MNKLQKAISYIELNNHQKDKQAVNDICDYYKLSDSDRIIVIKKFGAL